MKKLFSLIFIITTAFSVYSQESTGPARENEEILKKNEIKFNLPLAIFGSAPEVSYERIINADISVGTSLTIGLDRDMYPITFAFTPHFRWFLAKNRSADKNADGFFIEANGSLYSQSVEYYPYYDGNTGPEVTSQFGAGLGLAIGWKYLTKSNWVGEVLIGSREKLC